MPKRAIETLICLGLVLTPLFGLARWLRLFPALAAHLPFGEQIILIKAAKDVLLCLILFMFLLGVLQGCRLLYNPIVSLLLAVLAISFAVTTFVYGSTLALAGLRSLSPLLFLFVAYAYLDMTYIRRIVKVLLFLLLAEACAAWLVATSGLAVHGRTYFGLAARPSGSFPAPSSWSIFLCLTISFLMGYDICAFGRVRRKTLVPVGVAALLIFASSSGSGVLALTVLTVCYFVLFVKTHPYLKGATLLLLCLLSLGMLTHLDILLNRPGVYESFGTRLGLLSEVFSSFGVKEILIGRGLGVGSNAAVSIMKFDPTVFRSVDSLLVADSLYTSFLTQAGLFFLTTFLLLNVLLFRQALGARYRGVNAIVLLAIPVVLLGAFANITTEVFPVNWLFFIACGIALRQNGGCGYEELFPSRADGPSAVFVEEAE